MARRPLVLGFKGRMHAPSKPVGRGGKASSARPMRRTGHFGFVVPGLERAAWRADIAQDIARIRASREALQGALEG